MVHIIVYTGLCILAASEMIHFSTWGGRRGEGGELGRVGGKWEGERELEGEKDSNTTIPGTHLNTL